LPLPLNSPKQITFFVLVCLLHCLEHLATNHYFLYSRIYYSLALFSRAVKLFFTILSVLSSIISKSLSFGKSMGANPFGVLTTQIRGSEIQKGSVSSLKNLDVEEDSKVAEVSLTQSR